MEVDLQLLLLKQLMMVAAVAVELSKLEILIMQDMAEMVIQLQLQELQSLMQVVVELV